MRALGDGNRHMLYMAIYPTSVNDAACAPTTVSPTPPPNQTGWLLRLSRAALARPERSARGLLPACQRERPTTRAAALPCAIHSHHFWLLRYSSPHDACCNLRPIQYQHLRPLPGVPHLGVLFSGCSAAAGDAARYSRVRPPRGQCLVSPA